VSPLLTSTTPAGSRPGQLLHRQTPVSSGTRENCPGPPTANLSRWLGNDTGRWQDPTMFHTANRLTFQRVEALASDQPPHFRGGSTGSGRGDEADSTRGTGLPERSAAGEATGRGAGGTAGRDCAAAGDHRGGRGRPVGDAWVTHAAGQRHDPFAAPGATPALACRLYPNEDGRLDGAPTVQALRRALEQAGAQGDRRRPPAR
jgi:hypothetical protein